MNENNQPETEWIDVEPKDVQEGDEAYWTLPDCGTPVCYNIGASLMVDSICVYALSKFGVRFRRRVPRVPREWDMWAMVSDQGLCLATSSVRSAGYSTKVRIIEVIE